MKKTTKPCKHCGRDILKGLTKTCSIKCHEKYKALKEKEKRKIKREKKAISVTVLKKTLWTIISEYIRRKYADSD